jgi:hypothetical protein
MREENILGRSVTGLGPPGKAARWQECPPYIIVGEDERNIGKEVTDRDKM